MKIRHPWLISSLGMLGAWLLRLWNCSLRLRVHHEEGMTHPADARHHRFVYAFWHDSFLGMTPHKTKVYVLISHHADGEIIAQVCRHLRVGVARGSTSRGGLRGLLTLVRVSLKNHLAITPDGPRGPRHQAQLGAIQLASLTGLPIVPIGFGFSSAWRFRSWDRFALPKPFSTVTGISGPRIFVPKNLDRDAMERIRGKLEEELLRLTAAAEQWAASGRRTPPASQDPSRARRRTA